MTMGDRDYVSTEEHHDDLPAPMSRAEALTMAQEMTEKLSAVPMKSNGYSADGWKTPTLAERTDAILRLAEFLSGEK